MSEPEKIHIGNVKKNFTEPYSSIGTAAVFFGLTIIILVYFLQSIEKLQDYHSVFSILMGSMVLLVSVGIIMIICSCRTSMEAAYLEDGHCRIVDQTVKCQGGCNRCPFASQYLYQIGERQVRAAMPEQIAPKPAETDRCAAEQAPARVQPVNVTTVPETEAAAFGGSQPFAIQRQPVTEYAAYDDPLLPLHDRIVRLLQTSDLGFTIEEIAADLSQTADMIEPQITAMAVRREVVQNGWRYRIVAKKEPEKT